MAESSAISADDLSRHITQLPLIDHHVHSCLTEPLSRRRFEGMLTESERPPAKGASHLLSQLGFALRRHCAPLLGLPPHASADEYFETRSQLSPDQLTQTFLSQSGVEEWWVDTGYQGSTVMDLDQLSRVSRQTVREVVRIESVLEKTASQSSPRALMADFTDALNIATRTAVGVKSIIAYRLGFAFDPSRPTDHETRQAAEEWFSSTTPTRVTHPVLLRMALWAAVDRGLPIQLHAGLGDPDLTLHLCDPALLTPWLREMEPYGTRVILLHCYPYHRNAGYLAQAFPHVYFDVGLAVNYTGAASEHVVAESLEHAPFGKILYSSDAWGLPELHYLGSALWRRALKITLTRWVRDGEWDLADALAVATLIGRENALETYGTRDDRQ